MLSFINRSIDDFRRIHGTRPNRLFLNRNHLNHLYCELSGPSNSQRLVRLLNMEIIISSDIVHPHVEWRSKGPAKHAV